MCILIVHLYIIHNIIHKCVRARKNGGGGSGLGTRLGDDI